MHNGLASPSYVQLLVPLKVKADIKEEARLDFERCTALAIQEQIEQERLHQELTKELTAKAQVSSENKQPQTEPATPANGTEPKTVKPGFNEFMPPRELVAGTDYDPKLQYPVYTFDAPGKLFARSGLNTPDKDIRKRDDELYRKMTASTMLRDIAMPKDMVQALNALRFSQPHFGAVIDLIRGQLLLGERTNKTVRIPPILLDGAPVWVKPTLLWNWPRLWVQPLSVSPLTAPSPVPPLWVLSVDGAIPSLVLCLN